MSKVIIVTGASSGLGKCLAEYLQGKGYVVYGTSRSMAGGQHTFKSLVMDVCSKQSVEQAVQQVLSAEGRIDVLINNAGIGIAGASEHLQDEDMERVFNTNVLGVVRASQSVLPHMRKQGKGVIINVSSIASEAGLPYRGIYSASKAAVDRFTEAFRMEVKKFGVQACSLQLGSIITDINKNRIVSPMPADSVFKDSFDRTYEIINGRVSHGMTPESIGPVVESIINSAKIKRVYRVGKFAEKLSVFLKRVLPDHVYEGIISSHFKV